MDRRYFILGALLFALNVGSSAASVRIAHDKGGHQIGPKPSSCDKCRKSCNQFDLPKQVAAASGLLQPKRLLGFTVR